MYCSVALCSGIAVASRNGQKLLLKGVRAELPSGFDIEKHLTPHYNVWDQRVSGARR